MMLLTKLVLIFLGFSVIAGITLALVLYLIKDLFGDDNARRKP